MHQTLSRLALGAALLGAAVPGPTLAADPPRAVIEKLTSAVLKVLGNKSLATAEKRRQVEELVYAAVDFNALSRLTLAQNWSRFSPEQQAEFIREFKRHLALTYGDKVENYRNERVAVEGEQEEARGDRTVRTKVLRGGPDDIEIDYRLRQVNGEWKVIDFIIEHVSLVANYRSQFQDILAGGPPEKLLALLREKNARGEPLKAPGA